jgi:hypothetical protein
MNGTLVKKQKKTEKKMFFRNNKVYAKIHYSGIKRWTDGLVWSPSRILGNFLIYRELDKRLDKRSDRRKLSNASIGIGETDRVRQRSSSIDQNALVRNKERQLVGSFSDAYNYKGNGLIKKTMSIVVDGVHHHLVSYYHPNDVLEHRLRTPSHVLELANLEISPELLNRQNFRIPPMVEPDQLSTSSSSNSSSGGASTGNSTFSSAGITYTSIFYYIILTPIPFYIDYRPAIEYTHTRHHSISAYPSLPYQSRNNALNFDRNKTLYDSIQSFNLPHPSSTPSTPLPVHSNSTPLLRQSDLAPTFDHRLKYERKDHHQQDISIHSLVSNDGSYQNYSTSSSFHDLDQVAHSNKVYSIDENMLHWNVL